MAARVRTDDDGRFETPRVLAPGLVLLSHPSPWGALEVHDEPEAPGRMTVVRLGHADVEALEVVVPGGASLRVSVVTEDGAAIPGAVVTLSRLPVRRALDAAAGPAPIQVTAGRDGRVEFTGLPTDCRLNVSAVAKGWLPSTAMHARASVPGAACTVVLTRGARVLAETRLDDAITAKRCHVHLLPQEAGMRPLSALCAEQGDAAFDGVSPGAYVAVALADGPSGRTSVVASSAPFRVTGGVLHVLLERRAPLRIEGVVTQPDGTPFRSRRLGNQVVGPAHLVCRPVSYPETRAPQLNELRTDARGDGTFSLTVPAEGLYDVAVAGRKGVRIAAGARDARVPHPALVPGLRVVVHDAAGAPLAGARVLMVSPGAGETETRTNAEGVAESSAMEAGEAVVLATSPAGGAAVARVRVEPETATRQAVRLELRPGRPCRGVLLNEHAQPRPRERVHPVIDVAGRLIRLPTGGARTNAKGEFSAELPLLEGVRLGVARGLGSGFVLPAAQRLDQMYVLVLPEAVHTRSALEHLSLRERDAFLSRSR